MAKCPVCTYPYLDGPTCPQCTAELLAGDTPATYRRLRLQWVARGARWEGPRLPRDVVPPPGPAQIAPYWLRLVPRPELETPHDR